MRQWFFVVGVIFIFVVVLVGVIHVIRFYSFYSKIQVNANKEQYIEKQNVFDILIMGYGGEGHQGEYLTDTLMIAHIDISKQKVKLISVPRDTWVRIPTTTQLDYYTKINAVYQWGLNERAFPYADIDIKGEQGAINLLRSVLYEMTGIVIDNFVAVDFEGFEKTIDTLGGIEVEVETTFDDYLYPIAGRENDTCDEEATPILEDEDLATREGQIVEKGGEIVFTVTPSPLPTQGIATESADTQRPYIAYPCRYEHLHFDAGVTQMDGETALKFARSRKSEQDGGDFNRAARQQQVIDAVRKKVLTVGVIPKLLPLMDELDEHIRTDISWELLQKFLSEIDNAERYTLDMVVLSTDNVYAEAESEDGQAILIPQAGINQWGETREYINNALQGVSPTPSVVEEQEILLE